MENPPDPPQNNSQPTEVRPQTSPSMPRWQAGKPKVNFWMVTTVILIIILGFAVGYVLTQQGSEETPSVVPTVHPTTAIVTTTVPTATIAPEPTQDETEREASPAATSTTEAKYKTISDEENLFKITILADWSVTRSEGAKGGMLSYTSVESPDFEVFVDEAAEGPFTPFYYKQGVNLNIHVTQGEEERTPPGTIISQQDSEVDGQPAKYFVYKEISTFEGQQIQVEINYQGNRYSLTFNYNPATYPTGEEVFERILASFKFTP